MNYGHAPIIIIKRALFFTFFLARSQLTCNKCTGSRSGRGDCEEEQKCTTFETRCLAIRWGSNEAGKEPSTYDTRCATADECSPNSRQELCEDKDCESKCCESSKCDPFKKQQVSLHLVSCHEIVVDNGQVVVHT